MYSEIKFFPCGEKAVNIEFGNEISLEINEKVIHTMKHMQQENWEGIFEIIPSYRSILLHYDPFLWTYHEIVEKVKKLCETIVEENSKEKVTVIEIPVFYDEKVAPHLSSLMEKTKLEKEKLIQKHTEKIYRIYMFGSLPAFPYFDEIDSSLQVEKPKLHSEIEAGSVTIEGEKTSIYPFHSEGNSYIIGKTPIQLYTPKEKIPFLFEVGEYIQFVPIEEEEYYEIQKKVEIGAYPLKKKTVNRGDLHDK